MIVNDRLNFEPNRRISVLEPRTLKTETEPKRSSETVLGPT